MIKNLFIYLFQNVVQMVIIHKNIATFNYRQFFYLENLFKSFIIMVFYDILL
jgi:hypothetical protein